MSLNHNHLIWCRLHYCWIKGFSVWEAIFVKNLQKLHWGAKLQLNITMSSIKCNCSALKVKIISWRTKIAYAIVKFTYFENENIVVTEYQYVLYFITPQTKFEARQCFHRCLFVHGGGVGFPACITGQMTRAGLPSLLDAYPPMHTSLGADSPGCRYTAHGILRDTINKRVVRILL